jgi:hypothetical protein
VSVVVGIAMLVAGGVLSAIAMDDRADDIVTARVVGADLARSSAGAGSNVYRMVADNGDELTVQSERHLRLNERTFVRVADGSAPELAGVLDDGRFAIAVICCVLGLGLATSGIRSHRWAVRCARLDTLVDDWQRT